jgi:hypothetical protein
VIKTLQKRGLSSTPATVDSDGFSVGDRDLTSSYIPLAEDAGLNALFFEQPSEFSSRNELPPWDSREMECLFSDVTVQKSAV